MIGRGGALHQLGHELLGQPRAPLGRVHGNRPHQQAPGASMELTHNGAHHCVLLASDQGQHLATGGLLPEDAPPQAPIEPVLAREVALIEGDQRRGVGRRGVADRPRLRRWHRMTIMPRP